MCVKQRIQEHTKQTETISFDQDQIPQNPALNFGVGEYLLLKEQGDVKLRSVMTLSCYFFFLGCGGSGQIHHTHVRGCVFHLLTFHSFAFSFSTFIVVKPVVFRLHFIFCSDN